MAVIYKPPRILIVEAIRRNARYLKGVVLDIGSGESKGYESLFNYEKYITLDINPDYKPDIVASAEKIPLKDNSIDSILCTQVLEHTKEPLKIIEEIYRVLKPGGYVLLTAPLINEIHGEPDDFWRFTNFGFEYLFKKSGFKSVKIEQLGGFFSSQAYLKIRYLIDRFDLPNRRWLGFLRLPIKWYAKIMMFLDKMDKSSANKKHAFGWCVIAQKL